MSRKPSSSGSADPSPDSSSISSNPRPVKKTMRPKYSQSRRPCTLPNANQPGQWPSKVMYVGSRGQSSRDPTSQLRRFAKCRSERITARCHGGTATSSPDNRTGPRAARVNIDDASTGRRLPEPDLALTAPNLDPTEDLLDPLADAPPRPVARMQPSPGSRIERITSRNQRQGVFRQPAGSDDSDVGFRAGLAGQVVDANLNTGRLDRLDILAIGRQRMPAPRHFSRLRIPLYPALTAGTKGLRLPRDAHPDLVGDATTAIG